MVGRVPVQNKSSAVVPRGPAHTTSYRGPVRQTRLNGFPARQIQSLFLEPFFRLQFQHLSFSSDFLALRSFATDAKAKDKEKDKENKEKERLKKEKEKEKREKQKQLEKEKKEKQKQKELERKEKEKKAQAEKKEKERLRKEKEREKSIMMKEKEKEKVKKAKDKVVIQKEKAKETQAKGKEKERKEKKKKEDEGKPTRPLTAYTLFFRTRVAELRKTKPDTEVAMLAKQVGQDWSAMTDAQKQPFAKKAEEARKSYDEQMTAYQKTLPPKRPGSSFMLFSEEVRPTIVKQNPKMKTTDVAKALGQQWKQLTPQKKKRFEEKALQLKEQWQKEMDKRSKKAEKTAE